MNKIYKSKKNGKAIFTKVDLPKKKGDYLYFLKIGQDIQLYKIGTTNDVLRRMKEHVKYYNEDITILWVSPKYSKYTTLRVEDRMKEKWIAEGQWEYHNNDRFTIPKGTKEVRIVVKKEWVIQLE